MIVKMLLRRASLAFLVVAWMASVPLARSDVPGKVALRVVVRTEGGTAITRPVSVCLDGTTVRIERGELVATVRPGKLRARMSDPVLGIAERELDVTVSGPAELVLEPKAAGIVRGRVIDPDGIGVLGARLRVRGDDEPCAPAEDSVETGVDGSFAVVNVLGSSAALALTELPKGLVASERPRPGTSLGGPGSFVSVPSDVFVRAYPARDVTGTVITSDGRKPRAGWRGRVVARGYALEASDADADSFESDDLATLTTSGAFAFRQLPSRWIYSLWVCGANGFSDPVGVRPGMPPQTLRLAPSGTIAGRVIRNGAPVEARVDVEYIVNGNWEHCSGERNDPRTGRFEAQLAYGRGRLHIAADDPETGLRCESRLERDLTVLPGKRLDIGDVELRCRNDEIRADDSARATEPHVFVPQGATKIGRFIVSFDDPPSDENEHSHKRARELLGEVDLALSPLFGNGAPRTIRVRFSRDRRAVWDPEDPRWEDPFLDITERFDARVGAQVTFELGPEMSMRAPEHYGSRGPVLRWVLMHEAVHAFLGESFASNAPRWLREGSAEYFARAPGDARAPGFYPNDDALDEALARLESGSYEAARRKVAALADRCGEEAVVGWLLDLRTDAKAELGRRVACNTKTVAVWEWTPPLREIRHATMDELTTVLAHYRTRHGDYETPAGVELLPLDASVGLASSSSAFVLERTIRATKLPREDALDTLVAGLLPNRFGADATRRYQLLDSAYGRTKNKFVADLFGHALSYGEAAPDDEITRSMALLKLPRAVRAYWMGEALLRFGKHEAAEVFFEVAVREGAPNKDRAHFAYAVTACRTGHYETCLREMDLVQMEPRYIATPRGDSTYDHEATREWWRAKAFAKLGRHVEAISAFKESIVRFDLLNPAEPDPFGVIDADLRIVICETGISFAGEGKWKEASALFDRADCTEQRGRAFAAQGQWVDAFLAFEGAWEEPQIAESIAALATLGLPRTAVRKAEAAEGKCFLSKQPCERIAAVRQRIESELPAHSVASVRFLRAASAHDLDSDDDGDGLTNAEELWIGIEPGLADTDGDGVRDDLDPQPLAPIAFEPTVEDEAVYAAIGPRLWATKPPMYGEASQRLGASPRFLLSNRPLFRAWSLPSRMVVVDDDEADALFERSKPVVLEQVLVLSDAKSSRWLILYELDGRRGTVLAWKDPNGAWVTYALSDLKY